MKRSRYLTMFLLAMGIVDGGLLAAEGAVEVMMLPPAVKRVAAGDPLADRLSGAAERQLKKRGRKVSDRIPLREAGVEQRISMELRELQMVGPVVDEVEMLPAAGVVRPDGGSLISHMALAPRGEKEVGPLGVLVGVTEVIVEAEEGAAGVELPGVETGPALEEPVREVPLRREPGRDVPVPWVPVVPMRVVPSGLLLVRE
jgi:hypothetical protein